MRFSFSRKIYLILFLFLCSFFIYVSRSYATELSLFVSEKDLFIKAEQKAYTYVKNPLYVSGKFFYSKKNEKKAILGNIWIGVKDTRHKAFNMGLGFQGMLGKIKISEDTNNQTEDNFNIFAIGFKFMGVWRKEALNMFIGLPISFDFQIFYAPEILSFSDTKRVFSFKVGGYYYVTSNAALGISYQYYKITLNKTNWENSAIMLGIKISF